MKLKLERVVSKKPTWGLSLSPDGKTLIAIGAKKLHLYSLPKFDLINSINVIHVYSIQWVDHQTFYTITQTGHVAFWDGTELKSVGRWQRNLVSECPTFACGKDTFAISYNDGVSAFHADTGKTEVLYKDEDDTFVQIAGVKNGLIYGLLQKREPHSPNLLLNKTEKLLEEGKELRALALLLLEAKKPKKKYRPETRAFTLNPITREMRTAQLNADVLSLGLHPLLLPDGRIVVSTEVLSSKRPYDSALIAINPNDGSTETGERMPKNVFGFADFIGSSLSPTRYIAHVFNNSKNLLLFRLSDLSYAGKIDDCDLSERSECNCIATTLFLSDEQLVVGTWNEMLLFRIVDEE